MYVDLSLHTWAERSRYRRSVDLFFSRNAIDGKAQSVAPFEFFEIDQAARAIPSVSLDNNEAQELMDALWSCGLRPTEGSGSAGSLAATQEHLSDMRKIAFDLLGRKP